MVLAVSILVLMEYALRQYGGSLLDDSTEVSILVLMEYALRPGVALLQKSKSAVSILVLMEYALRLPQSDDVQLIG